MKKLHKAFLVFLLLLLSILSGSTTKKFIVSNDRFYLSNNSCFSPGSEVIVNLQTYSSKKNFFIFRLIRIINPSEFFSNCELQNLRNNFDILGKDQEYLLKHTELIKEWNEKLSPSSYYYNNTLSVGKINKPGFYILQAFKRDQVAYCGIIVSDLAIVYKYSSNQVLAFVSNFRTSEFVTDTKFDFYSDNKLIESKKSDEEGIVLFKSGKPLSLLNRNSTFIIAQTDNEVVLSDPYFYFYRKEKYNAYIYTSQPVYRPGQEVFFKAIIRDIEGRDLLNVVNESFTITIKSDNKKEVYNSVLETNEFGSISGSFFLDKQADLGIYSIELAKDDIKCYGAFSVEEYKKAEFKVNILTAERSYKQDDLIEGKITAEYFFGSPLKDGKINFNIFRSTFWRPWWYGSEHAWFYRNFDSYDNHQFEDNILLEHVEGSLDENGEYNFSYKIGDDLDDDFIYTVGAEVYDNSRRTVYERKEFYVTRGGFTISTLPEKHLFGKGEPINLLLTIETLANEPIEKDFIVYIKYSGLSRQHLDYDQSENEMTISGKTDRDGKAVVKFSSSGLKSGFYSYTIEAEDENGTKISTDNFFYSGDHNYYFGSGLAYIQIITDKDVYEIGDSLTAYIFLPNSNIELLLSYERNDFIDYNKIKTFNNSIVIREKIDEVFSPSFDISITYQYNQKLFTQSKRIGVLNKEKLLNVEIHPSKDIYQPGDSAEYVVSVKDINGNPVKNTELSFGVIDESIYAIREDRDVDMQTFFNISNQKRISTNHSLILKSIRGSSRTSSSYERNYYGNLVGSGFSVCNFSGNITIPVGDSARYDVILTNNDNFYTTQIDKDGYYEFILIDEGEYDLYLADGSSLALVSKIKTYTKKFDFDLKEIMDRFIKDSIYDESGETKDILILEERFFEQHSTNTVKVIDSDQISRLPVRGVESIFSLQAGTDENYLEARLRSKLVDAAFWGAHIITDSLGLAVVKFQLPDNLTIWRTTARAVTVDSKSGQQVNKVMSRKNLLVRMEPPRFFREGDEMTISTIVHNYLDESKKTKISFEVEQLDLIASRINSISYSNDKDFSKRNNNNVYEIIVNKNSELRIDWIVKVNVPSGEAKLTARALTDEESDAVELKVPILPKGFKEVIPFALESPVDKPEEIVILIPEDVDLNTVELSFSMSPSIAGTILTALDDLVGYPYGCVEQTMSKFLPSILVANTFKESNVPLKANTIDELPKMVDAGLDKLYGYQHNDGGWGWWNHDATHPYMTAYVVYGLSLARTAGYKVREKVFNEGFENLKSQIVNFKTKFSEDETTLAFMLFAFSTAIKTVGNEDPISGPIINELFQKSLNPYSIALLGISSYNLNLPELCSKSISKLKLLAKEEDSYAYWDEENINYRWQKDRVQSTAFALSAILKCTDDKELTQKIVQWLLTQKKGFSWRSTQESAVVIFALAEYLKSNLELNPDYNAEIFINDKLITEMYFTKEDVYRDQKTFNLTETNKEALNNGTNIIRITKAGVGKIYFSGLIQYFTKTETSNMALQKFFIEREYFILEPENKDGRLVYVKKEFAGIVESGDNIFVKTVVKSRDENLQYFILEDMLPSGFEPVTDERYFEIEGEQNYGFDDSYSNNWKWFYSDKEFRDEKVSFFVTNTSEEMEFSYILKAQIPGTYTAMPPNGALMYYPEVSSHGSMIDIVVDDNPF